MLKFSIECQYSQSNVCLVYRMLILIFHIIEDLLTNFFMILNNVISLCLKVGRPRQSKQGLYQNTSK